MNLLVFLSTAISSFSQNHDTHTNIIKENLFPESHLETSNVVHAFPKVKSSFFQHLLD